MYHNGVPAPSVVGFELSDESSGATIAEAEMVWEYKKIVWLLPEQKEYMDIFKGKGWTVRNYDMDSTRNGEAGAYNMSLKNVLIIVDNIDESIDFYEELFGLRVITRMEGNVIMSEGLVLQDVDVWYDSTKIPTTPHNNMTELYFEDNDIEGIIEKLESGKYVVSYVTELTELDGGQKLVRFYDPSGNLIEVRTPVNHN